MPVNDRYDAVPCRGRPWWSGTAQSTRCERRFSECSTAWAVRFRRAVWVVSSRRPVRRRQRPGRGGTRGVRRYVRMDRGRGQRPVDPPRTRRPCDPNRMRRTHSDPGNRRTVQGRSRRRPRPGDPRSRSSSRWRHLSMGNGWSSTSGRGIRYERPRGGCSTSAGGRVRKGIPNEWCLRRRDQRRRLEFGGGSAPVRSARWKL